MKKVMLAILAGLIIILLGGYFFFGHYHNIYIQKYPTITDEEGEKICEADLFSVKCRDFARSKLHQQIYQSRMNKDGLDCWLPFDEKSWYFNLECTGYAK